MRLVKATDIDSPDGLRRLELVCGDLTDTPAEFASDVLVVSAFPGDYTPTPSSLIGSLYWKGISVAELAANKYADLRRDFSCWLSTEIVPKPGLPFRRILCFEPAARGRAPELISDIFRAIDPFSLGPPFLASAMIPFVATGDQGYGVDEVGRALIEAAWHRLDAGHPFRIIRLAAQDETIARKVGPLFSEIVEKGTAAREIHPSKTTSTELARDGLAIERAGDNATDVFISYSRIDKDAARAVAHQLQSSGLSVFIDEQSIDIGAAWQTVIFEAIEKCRCVVVLYSPDFLASRVCKDEFSAAMILRRKRDREFIFPLLVRQTDLPAYMEMLNYTDCCVSDTQKISVAARKLAASL